MANQFIIHGLSEEGKAYRAALEAIQELHSRQVIHLPSWDPHGHPEYRESTQCKACGSAENPCRTRRLADQGLGDNLARTTKNGENNGR